MSLAHEINKQFWACTRLTRSEFESLLRDDLPVSKALPKPYLDQLIAVMADVYEAEFPPDLPDDPRHLLKLTDHELAQELLLITCRDALVRLTNAFPVHDAPPATFMAELPVFQGDEFTPELKAAFAAFCYPFKVAQLDLQAYGIFDWSSMYPYGWEPFDERKPRFRPESLGHSEFYESEPIFGDQFERRAWRNRKRDFEQQQKRDKQSHEQSLASRKLEFEDFTLVEWESRKAHYEQFHKQVHKNTLPWMETFNGTPFFAHYSALVPHLFVPLTIPLLKRFEAQYIIGYQGSGKTTLMIAQILPEIEQVLRNEASLVAIDAKDELLKVIPRLACFVGTDKLIYIDPQDDLAVNPLDLGGGNPDLVAEHIASIFKTYSDELTKTQHTLLFNCIRALIIDWDSPTLETLQHLLSNGLRKDNKGFITGHFAEFARKHSDRDARTFLTQNFHAETYTKTKDEVIRRLEDLRTNPVIRKWFTTKKTSFKLAEHIDHAKVIVINCNYEQLTQRGAEFIARFYVAQIKAIGDRRTSGDHNLPIYLYVDEADKVLKTDHNIEEIIGKLRSKKIALTVAHQWLSQFNGNRETLQALLNSAILMANAQEDANTLASRFLLDDPTKHHLSPKELNLDTGYFAAYIRGHKPKSQIIKVHKRDPALMSEAEFQAIRAKMRERYGRQPEKRPQPAPPRQHQPPPPPPKPKPAGDDREDV